jgi:hypothetical protein
MPIAKCSFEPYGANLDRKNINFPIEHNPYNELSTQHITRQPTQLFQLGHFKNIFSKLHDLIISSFDLFDGCDVPHGL